MAAVVLTMTEVCAGGEHVKINATVNGANQGTRSFAVTELMSALTADEIEAAVKVIVRLHAIGKTKGQVASDLTGGLSLTI